MTYDSKTGEYVLSTGRMVDAQALFDPNDQIETRSDGSLWTLAQSDIGIEIGRLTPEECVEVAHYVIGCWHRWSERFMTRGLDATEGH